MKKRLMCVWLPQWPLQETLARQPDWKEHPVVLHAAGRQGGQVVMRSRKAAAQGVRPGMPLAQARALLEKAVPAPKYESFDPPTHNAALRSLAEWCIQFSPVVGLEEADAPEGLFLDIAGCDHLFGGESAMAERVVRACAERGLVARVAVADTPGAAWAVAHYGRQIARVISPGQQAQVLQVLPVEALRLIPAAVDKLRQLAIHTVAQLQALPRESLPSRFGLEILHRLDQALGHRPELVRPVVPLPPVEVAQSFLYPTTERWILEVALQKLLDDMILLVREKNQGIQELLCRFVGERREEMQFTIRLLQPAASARRLFELVRLRLDAVRMSDICEIHLRAEVEVVEVSHYSLFDGADLLDRRGELTGLIERLSSRLGPRAVARPQWSLNPQPELAIAYQSALGMQSPRMAIRGKKPSSRSSHGLPSVGLEVLSSRTAPFRPPQLTRDPIPIEVMSVVPDGPPLRFFWQGQAHRVAHCWGPERIETGWWLGRHVRRDYYRVETTSGLRFWLFRHIEEGRWFLHGIFA